MVGNGERARRENRSYLYRGNGLYVSAGRSGMACKQTAFRYLILSVRPASRRLSQSDISAATNTRHVCDCEILY